LKKESMPNIEENDLRFFRSTANELNNLLTELSGYMEVMDSILRKSGGDQRLIPMMNDTVDRATNLTLAIQRHVYSKEGREAALEYAVDTNPPPARPSASSPAEPPSAAGPVEKETGPSAQSSPAGESPRPRKILGLDVPSRAEENARHNPVDITSGHDESSPEPHREARPGDSGESQAASSDVKETGPSRPSADPARSRDRESGSATHAPPTFELNTGNSMGSSRNIDSALMGKQETILVVDDEKNILLLVEMMLRSANYRMLKAADGEEALAIFADQADEIDLVILDFSMQGMDGQELFERMIELKPDACILVSSGYAEAGALKEMMAKGLRGYIPKPYSRDRLLYQIKSVLEG
jgi:CheY-like chemotaxis protein